MNMYLYEVVRDVPMTPALNWAIDLPAYQNSADESTPIMFQLKNWYALSIIKRLFVTSEGWESLLTDRSERQAQG